MTDLDRRRRFFAEEVEAVARLKSAALVDAFATVRREEFLPPGPWTVLSDHADWSGLLDTIAATGNILWRWTPPEMRLKFPVRPYLDNAYVVYDPDKIFWAYDWATCIVLPQHRSKFDCTSGQNQPERRREHNF